MSYPTLNRKQAVSISTTDVLSLLNTSEMLYHFDLINDSDTLFIVAYRLFKQLETTVPTFYTAFINRDSIVVHHWRELINKEEGVIE